MCQSCPVPFGRKTGRGPVSVPEVPTRSNSNHLRFWCAGNCSPVNIKNCMCLLYTKLNSFYVLQPVVRFNSGFNQWYLQYILILLLLQYFKIFQLTAASLSNLLNSWWRVLTRKAALHCDASSVNPSMSANSMLLKKISSWIIHLLWNFDST